MYVLYEEKPLVSKEFSFMTNAAADVVTSSLAICNDTVDLKRRLEIEGYVSFLICKN